MHRKHFQSGTIFVGLLLSLASILFCGIVIEAVIRFGFDQEEDLRGWSDRPKFYFRHENSSSMQDFPVEQEKPEGTFRIAVVGDSFTFAPFMQFTDAFPKKLEQLLNLNSESRRVEVLNLGVPSYSTHHEVDVVRRAVRMGADLIILQITLNDPELKPYTPTGLQEGMVDRFGEYVAHGWRRTFYKYWKTGEFISRRLHNRKTHQAYRDYFFDLFENRRTREAFEKALADIVRISERRNVPLVAVTFPLFGTPLDERYPFIPLHQIVESLLTSMQVPNLDLLSIYRNIPTDRLLVIPGVDRHPNEIAHRMAAEEIYLWLSNEGMIDQEFHIKEKFRQRIGTVNQARYGESSENK